MKMTLLLILSSVVVSSLCQVLWSLSISGNHYLAGLSSDRQFYGGFLVAFCQARVSTQDSPLNELVLWKRVEGLAIVLWSFHFFSLFVYHGIWCAFFFSSFRLLLLLRLNFYG
jgi:hypothetical protein